MPLNQTGDGGGMITVNAPGLERDGDERKPEIAPTPIDSREPVAKVWLVKKNTFSRSHSSALSVQTYTGSTCTHNTDVANIIFGCLRYSCNVPSINSSQAEHVHSTVGVPV